MASQIFPVPGPSQDAFNAVSDKIDKKVQYALLGSITYGTSATFTLAKSSKLVFFAIGSSTTNGAWIVNTTSSGGVKVFELGSDSSIGCTSPENNKVTFTNSHGSVSPNLYVLIFYGSVS